MRHGIFTASSTKKCDRRSSNLFKDLAEYYTPEKIETELVPFIEGKNNISGRMCDYVLTTFAKKNFCPAGEYDIRQLYDLTLRESGGRYLFDPFSRISSGIPVTFSLNDTKFTTTVAQMNFVRWYHRHGINDFMVKNKRRISEDMKQTYRRIKQSSPIGSKRKRQSIGGYDSHNTIVLCAEKIIFL